MINNWHKFTISKQNGKNYNLLNGKIAWLNKNHNGNEIEKWIIDCLTELLNEYYIEFEKITILCKNTENKIFSKILFEHRIGSIPFSAIVINVPKNTMTGHYKKWMYERNRIFNESKLKLFDQEIKIPENSKFMKEKGILNNYIKSLDVPIAQTVNVLFNTFLKLKEKYGYKNNKFSKNVLINICKLPNEIILVICNMVYQNKRKNYRIPNHSYLY